MPWRIWEFTLVGSNQKTGMELDKLAAKDAVSSFIRLQARDYHRREMNNIWPQVNEAIDAALANGDAVDVPALIRQVWNGKVIG